MIKEGVEGMLWETKTPLDVITWLKDEANSFHWGSQCTFLEMFNEVAPAIAAWDAHRLRNAITVHSCPASGDGSFRNVQVEFILKNFGKKYANREVFEHCRAFTREAARWGIMERFGTFMEERCLFAAAGLQNAVVAKVQ